MAELGLKVNGKEYSGWKTARITETMEAVAGSFELSVSDRWDGQAKPWPIVEEDECILAIDGAAVIKGWVDKRTISYGAGEHSFTVSGRDKAGTLVDCSVQLNEWEFKGLDILKFAKKICDPYGINVRLQGGLSGGVLPAPPKKLNVDPGDTAFNALEHACRMMGLLPLSDGAGGVVLSRVGTTRCETELVEGQNILAASAEFDCSGRFSTYAVLGQHRGSDDFFGEAASTELKGFATDADVKRTVRTLLIRPEGNVTLEHAKKRAEWEATVRAARGDQVTVTVQGWAQKAGAARWRSNAKVRVRSPMLGINGDMLITEVTFSLDDAGRTTRLTLKRPDAFKPEPVKKTNRDGLWKEIAKGV